MGSKQRIGNRLRQNADFNAIKNWLNAADLPFTVYSPTGKGHPYIIIITMTDGTELRHIVACSPRACGHPVGAISYLRRKLREAGYIEGV